MWVEYPFQVTFNAPLYLDWTPGLPLETFNIAWNDFSPGVYIVWRPDPDTGLRRAVYVGQGIIKVRLSFHRRSKNEGTDGDDYLRATWAPVEKADRNGVEAYLAQRLRPEQGDVWPKVAGIPVNLPDL